MRATYSCYCQEEKVAQGIVRQEAPKQPKPRCWFASLKRSQFCLRAWGGFDSRACISRTGKSIHLLSQHRALRRTASSEAWCDELSCNLCVGLLAVAYLLVNHQLWESLKPNANEQFHPLKELIVSAFHLSKSWAPSLVLRMLVSASKWSKSIHVTCFFLRSEARKETAAWRHPFLHAWAPRCANCTPRKERLYLWRLSCQLSFVLPFWIVKWM